MYINHSQKRRRVFMKKYLRTLFWSVSGGVLPFRWESSFQENHAVFWNDDSLKARKYGRLQLPGFLW